MMKLHNLLVLFLLLVVKATTIGAATITTLPGYEGTLPFQLETGYIGVDNEDKQLFYYFVQSQRDASKDPILFWVSGGPGFSSLWGFFYENGPLNFDLSYTFDGTLPKLLDNEYGWTKFMSTLFVDGPAGTGFSYAQTAEGYATGNFLFADNLNEFIHKWLESHESFRSNPIYFSGDGFSGNFIPILLDSVQKDNEEGQKKPVNAAGYLLVGPGADFEADFNSRYEYANRMGLVADEIFKPAEEACNGSYLNPPTDACTEQMAIIQDLIDNINTAHILEPACGGDTQQVRLGRSLQEGFTSFLKQPTDEPPRPWCRKYNHEVCNVWANFDGVADALGVRPGTKPSPWALYNETLDKQSYDKDDITNLVPYHKNLSNTDINSLIMCGDHDMDIPFLSTQKWIWSLELPLVESWRVWSVDNETAGYTRKFENGGFNLTFATVKGGGHFAPEYKPKECYKMVYNWTNGLSL